ncbi:hypothetical protein LX13_001336 [Williamsia maris]|uniref:Uncharacterized protein n=1 Tax=Williamsia maris TaxID=72806 RepID=A0ABT1HBA5_9NOCA|nr:hypothetical protein [Williamsia maris]
MMLIAGSALSWWLGSRQHIRNLVKAVVAVIDHGLLDAVSCA